ncbi:MAG: DUF4124 domain-containing protein [Gammaproteobacteria bacterium]|nr:DUF4124 domain-containing protein [Gammaproteobacteria bacterium]MDE2346090.1 DUF4124 domain-containing protein [Gammaproteobacteria bacterium]
MRKLIITILCSIVFGTCSTAAFAGSPQIYKWVDSQGVVHYSDKAPATPQQHMQLIALAPLPAVDAQTEAQNRAWIVSINQWYQNMVSLETEQRYNQILAWQASQDQAAESGATSQQNETGTSLVYVGYNPYQFHHHVYHPHHGKRPGHFSPPSLVFQPDLWDTRPNAFSQQLFNTNPNIH